MLQMPMPPTREADALKAQGKQVRATADAQADQLQERAREIRNAKPAKSVTLKMQAHDLKAQAEAVKNQ